MTNYKKLYRNLHKEKDLNGYEWFCFSDGVHNFQKEFQYAYIHIQLTEEMIHNGDLEFCCKHDISMGKEMLAKAKRKANKSKQDTTL